MEKKDLTGIVLAGGKSLRMGTTKALVTLNGKMLIEYPIHLAEQFCTDILISSNQPLPFPYPVIKDQFEDCGPMAGIYACLLKSRTPFNLVLSCDMPLINENLIRKLIELPDAGNIIVPVHDHGLFEPLCAIYPSHCVKSLEASLNQHRLALHEFITGQPHVKVNLTEAAIPGITKMFTNINTPEELERIQSI